MLGTPFALPKLSLRQWLCFVWRILRTLFLGYFAPNSAMPNSQMVIAVGHDSADGKIVLDAKAASGVRICWPVRYLFFFSSHSPSMFSNFGAVITFSSKFCHSGHIGYMRIQGQTRPTMLL